MDARHRRASQLAELVLSPELVEGSKGSNKARRIMRASIKRAGQQVSDLGRRA